ncbi:DUF2357 domain-containing protein [Pyrococcus sp. ST04]|uniref:DUF2357 domain-containing protein n=1 Tax=Pyrococcus sp. ST04 TaxID=1183377 RepID=UPI0002605CDF|nr:DUF2357 domain-containing protein [Pyrococcus sp. ST04]AFK22417.1 hypothetical protein Py04_0825 [Pyrococcus sp. ST04]
MITEKVIIKPEPLRHDEKMYLLEFVEYKFISDERFSIIVNGEEIKAEKLNKDFIVTLKFKNYVGKATIEIVKNEKEKKIEVEVISKKIGKIYGIKENDIENLIRANEEFYRNLVEEITNYSLSLPFSISSPTTFPARSEGEEINELFAYHFLTNNLERISQAIEEIVKRPHKKLTEEVVGVYPWEISEVDEDVLLTISLNPLTRIGLDKVQSRENYETLDTPENRFIKHFLKELIYWGERTLKVIRDESAKEKLTNALDTLDFYLSNDIFLEVGDTTLVPYSSQVILKKEGYREILELWQEFTAYSPFFSELNRAIKNKDIAKLYEYWAFFRLIHDIGKALNVKEINLVIEPTGEISESGDVYAEFGNGWRLYYNKKLMPKKWSYSVSLRPDFSLFTGDPGKKESKIIGVFDAKFKVEEINMEEFAEESENPKSLETWAKLEDILKMHTYRDALQCRFAVVLYPGNKNMFFEVGKDVKYEDFEISKLLGDVTISGVGYIRYIPRGDLEWEEISETL